jgi:hypothetical protein
MEFVIFDCNSNYVKMKKKLRYFVHIYHKGTLKKRMHRRKLWEKMTINYEFSETAQVA